MSRYTPEQIRAKIQINGAYKDKKLTWQERRTLAGQVRSGNPDAAMKGLRKILTRKQGRGSV